MLRRCFSHVVSQAQLTAVINHRSIRHEKIFLVTGVFEWSFGILILGAVFTNYLYQFIASFDFD